MASSASPIANTTPARSMESTNESPIQSFRGGPRDRHRNRQQGGNRAINQGHSTLESSTPQPSRGSSRGRYSRSRGRGDLGMHRLNLQDRGRDQVADSHAQPAPQLDLPPVPGGGGTYGGRLTIDAKTTEGEGLMKDPMKEDEEIEVCFICASPVVHSSVAPCNHRTCHICALRLRALYKTRACAHCRSEAKYVIFTDDQQKPYEDYAEADFVATDEALGIKYQQREIHDDTLLLLRYNCPDSACDIACWGWPDLHKHVKNEHHKVMCDLCTRNKKVFTHEHELFTVQELRLHERVGDDNPGALDQSGFRGHPECGFCRTRFYGDDELYAHCRDKHERCHVCDRRLQGREHQYYVNYGALEQHFRNDHFLCLDRECQEKKFVVFESEMDLKAHQLEAHPNDLSKDARRDARRVDMSAFDYRAPIQESRRGRRERDGGGRGRGRDPNAEALPQSTAQPLRRDELAFQRQMAIQSAQSISARTFGGQLTPSDNSTPRPRGRNQGPSSMTASRPRPHSNVSDPSSPQLDSGPASTQPETLTPQEQARRLHHTAVMERAASLLQNDPIRTASFRDGVSAFRTSKISATQVLDTFFSLFSVPASELGKLIKELADIYEDESKRQDLLKAWNDWRAINEDYPSLPGPGGVLPGSSAAEARSGGHRVLKLKNSTAQSSRSAVSKQGSWGNAAAANPFPPMPITSSSSSSSTRAGVARTTSAIVPWLTPTTSQTPSSRPPSSRPSSRPPGFQALASTPSSADAAFPALPAAAKPNTTMLGLTRGSVRWDRGATNTSGGGAWGAGSGGGGGDGRGGEGGGGVGGKGTEKNGNGNGNGTGKGKAKKQTLYRFG